MSRPSELSVLFPLLFPLSHCSKRSYFRPVTNGYVDEFPDKRGNHIATAAQCESCKGFVLVVGSRPRGQAQYNLDAVYPLGKPDDKVDEAIPEDIASDFREALCCLWIKAYKAAVVMCRRSIQASAIASKAKGDKLIDQIDDLAKQGKITQALREFAHVVRLAGNIGAHPDKDGLKDVGEKDANDVVEFTREHLHHVYVMPAKLKARKEPPQPEAKP